MVLTLTGSGSTLKKILEVFGWFLFLLGNSSLAAIVLVLVACYKFVPKAGIAWEVIPLYMLLGSPGSLVVGGLLVYLLRSKTHAEEVESS